MDLMFEYLILYVLYLYTRLYIRTSYLYSLTRNLIRVISYLCETAKSL